MPIMAQTEKIQILTLKRFKNLQTYKLLIDNIEILLKFQSEKTLARN